MGARLAGKSNNQAAQLSYCGSLLTEDRNGLIVDTDLRAATGTAERDAAASLLNGGGGRGVTLGADKAYDTRALHPGKAHLAAARQKRPDLLQARRF